MKCILYLSVISLKYQFIENNIWNNYKSVKYSYKKILVEQCNQVNYIKTNKRYLIYSRYVFVCITYT